MIETYMLDLTLSNLGKAGFYVCTTKEGYAIADPLDDSQGYYIEGPDLIELANEAHTFAFGC